MTDRPTRVEALETSPFVYEAVCEHGGHFTFGRTALNRNGGTIRWSCWAGAMHESTVAQQEEIPGL